MRARSTAIAPSILTSNSGASRLSEIFSVWLKICTFTGREADLITSSKVLLGNGGVVRARVEKLLNQRQGFRIALLLLFQLVDFSYQCLDLVSLTKPLWQVEARPQKSKYKSTD